MTTNTETLNRARARTARLPASRRGPGRPRQLARDTRSAYGFLSFNLAGSCCSLVPVVFSVYLSFFNWPLEGGRTQFIGLGNYSDALSSYGFWRVVLNVLYFMGVYVPLNLIVSLTLAALLPAYARRQGQAPAAGRLFLPVVIRWSPARWSGR